MAKIVKNDLVKEIAAKAGLSQKEAGVAYNAVIDTIKQHVVDGDEIAILKFGTFKQAHRGARKGRNPQTGEEITIPAHNAPVFHVSSFFKDQVKNAK